MLGSPQQTQREEPAAQTTAPSEAVAPGFHLQRQALASLVFGDPTFLQTDGIPLSARGLARLFDTTFGDWERIGSHIDWLLEIRSGESDRRGSVSEGLGPALPKEILQSIADRGYVATIEHAQSDEERTKIEALYHTLLTDASLILALQHEIFWSDARDVSPFWELQGFAPKEVIIYDVAKACRVGYLLRERHVRPLPYQFELDGETLIVKLGRLQEYVGRRAIALLRLSDDAELTTLFRSDRELDKTTAGRAWREYFEASVKRGERSTEAVIPTSGPLALHIPDRYRCGELLDSAVAIGLMEP